jgi:hypothetical protein
MAAAAHNLGTAMPPMQRPLQFANDPPRGPAFPQGRPQDPMAGWNLPGPGNMNGVLANGMASLNLDNRAAGKPKPTVDQEKSNKAPKPLDTESAKPMYEAWVFYRAEPEEGQKPTWTRAYKRPLRLDQEALEKKAKDRKKKPSAEQYQSLSAARRALVDRLIKEHEDKDHRFRWTCAYVKSKRQYVRKPFSGVDFEITEMEIVLVRKPRPEYAPEPSSKSAFGEFVDLNAPSKAKEAKPKKDPLNWDPKNVEFPGNGFHFDRRPGLGPHLGNMGPAAQQMNDQIPFTQHPHFLPREGPHGGPAFTEGIANAPMNAMPQQQRPPPPPTVFPGMMRPPVGAQDHRGGPGIEIIREDRPPPLHVPSMHSPPQPRNLHGAFDPVMNDFANRARKAQAKPPPPKIFQQEHHSAHSFKKQPAPELFSESSSIEDDESLFDDVEYSSATTDFDEIAPFPRGNLHKRRQSSTRQEEPSYRTHYRKQPQNIERRGSSYPTSPVDIFPERNIHHRRPSREIRYSELPSAARPKSNYDNKDDLLKIVQTSKAIDSLQVKLREAERKIEHEREKGQERALRERELEAGRLEQAKYHLLGLQERLQEREYDVKRREDALVSRENENRLLGRRYPRHGPPSPRREPGYLARDDFMYDYWR